MHACMYFLYSSFSSVSRETRPAWQARQGGGRACWGRVRPGQGGRRVRTHLPASDTSSVAETSLAAASRGRRRAEGRDPPQTECKLQFPIFSSPATYSCPFQRLLSPFLGNISKLRILESVSVIHFPSILWHPSEVQYKRVGAKPRPLRGGAGRAVRQPTTALAAPCECQLSNSNAGVAHTFNFGRALWL